MSSYPGQVESGSKEHIALISAGQRRARDRMMAGEGFIYVLELPDPQHIKVGFSLDPEKRAERWLGARLLGFFPATLKQERPSTRCCVRTA